MNALKIFFVLVAFSVLNFSAVNANACSGSDSASTNSNEESFADYIEDESKNNMEASNEIGFDKTKQSRVTASQDDTKEMKITDKKNR